MVGNMGHGLVNQNLLSLPSGSVKMEGRKEGRKDGRTDGQTDEPGAGYQGAYLTYVTRPCFKTKNTKRKEG